ncbi:MAG: SDR family NAD(P)-dependent oxidoreductase [Pseudomonadota bacterium]
MKTALLTGSTGGLGEQVVQILAQEGWNLILLNRDKTQADKQLDSLRVQFPKQVFDSFIVNLMDIDSVQNIAEEIASTHPKISALYNVAGLLTDKRIMSPQNIEGHFALNAVAPYMLIQSLQGQLQAAATKSNPAVVINFSTSAVNGVKTLDAGKLVNPDTIGGLMDAYAKSKFVLNLMSCFFKDELAEKNIYIFAADPGATKTQMTDGNEGMPWFVRLLVPLLFGDPSKQAKKLVKGVQRAIEKKDTGLFISNGKIIDNPALANDLHLQQEVRQLMDDLVTAGG